MLGFLIPEHDTGVNPEQDMDFDLTSLSAAGSPGGEGWVDWPAGNVLDGTGAGTDMGVDEYAGDGTIDPSVLGGGSNSPNKPDAYSSSPMHQFSRDRGGEDDGDYEEEDDVMGLLFQNTSDDDFSPPSGLGRGKGKGKSRAASMDTQVESPIGVGAAPAATVARIRKKSWRKTLADGDDEGDEELPHMHAISAPVGLDARPKKRRRILSSSSSSGQSTFCHHCRCTSLRPKMRCTKIAASTGKPCLKFFCQNCIEKRYALQIPAYTYRL